MGQWETPSDELRSLGPGDAAPYYAATSYPGTLTETAHWPWRLLPSRGLGRWPAGVSKYSRPDGAPGPPVLRQTGPAQAGALPPFSGGGRRALGRLAHPGLGICFAPAQSFHFPLFMTMLHLAVIFLFSALSRALVQCSSHRARVVLSWADYLRRVAPTGTCLQGAAGEGCWGGRSRSSVLDLGGGPDQGN